ncbi:hypothetical protein FBUS_05649 [Fasciolopsis buskii]|uniref:Uncharacterized protein n=1 Tax=Fasciolopsis buskii TaxID=27845 RepID=A0A8E0RW71_9TREM|nr:hypothetical protein FBUS_05649 [Fasciolopsis buski]
MPLICPWVSAYEGIKSAIALVASHTKQFIADFEIVNEKAFKTMADFLKHPSNTENPANKFLAILDSWKQVCSGAEEVTENFLHKMSLMSTRYPSKCARILNFGLFLQICLIGCQLSNVRQTSPPGRCRGFWI